MSTRTQGTRTARTSRKTYHTDLLFRFRLGLLPEPFHKSIPASTLSNWRKRDLSRITGADLAITEENLQLIRDFLACKKLLAAAKALWHVHRFLLSLLLGLKSASKILRQNQQAIVALIRRAVPALGIRRAASLLGISLHQFYAWQAKTCSLGKSHFCKRGRPQQLTFAETQTICEYFSEPAFRRWSAVSVYWQMIRDKAAALSLSTFYKYLQRLQLSRKSLRRRDLIRYLPIRAKRCLEILHADLTLFRPLDHSRVFIYIVQDNFSRAILSATASLSYSSQVAFENLSRACTLHGLFHKPIQLITDGGCENKGKVSDFLASPGLLIENLIAQVDIRSSNSMIEAVNKKIKYDFLYANPPPDFPSTVLFLQKAVEEYNNKPLHVLHGLTPLEVLHGKIPEKHFTQNFIAQAKVNRIATNQNHDCELCLSPEKQG